MNPEIEAGTLDRRVMLLQPVLNPESDEIESWQEVGLVWAAVEPRIVGSEETSASGRMVAMTPVAITIRYRADVDVRWRISERGTEYEIRSMVDVLRRRVQLQLMCEEVA